MQPKTIFDLDREDSICSIAFYKFLSVFILKNYEIEQQKIGPNRNFTNDQLSAIKLYADSLILALEEPFKVPKLFNFDSYNDDVGSHYADYRKHFAPNVTSVENEEGHIFRKIWSSFSTTAEYTKKNPFSYGERYGTSLVTYDYQYCRRNFANLFLIIQPYKFASKDKDVNTIYEETLKITKNFLKNTDKKKAFIKILDYNFNQNVMVDTRIYNFSILNEFYLVTVTPFIELLNKNCTVDEFMNFVFLQYMSFIFTSSYDFCYETTRISEYKWKTYIRFFWLLSLVFSEDYLDGVITQFHENLYGIDAAYNISDKEFYSDDFILSVSEFSNNYKDILSCNTSLKDFYKIQFDKILINSIKKLSKLKKKQLIHNIIGDCAQNRYTTTAVIETLTDSLFSKNNKNKEFLKALLEGNRFSDLYLSNFIPVMGTWLDNDPIFKKLQSSFSKTELSKNIALPQNTLHFKQLISCGFVFYQKPTLENIFCAYKPPKDWFIEDSIMFDDKNCMRAGFRLKRSEPIARSSVLQEENYLCFIEFFDRYYYQITDQLYFQIRDRQNNTQIYSEYVSNENNPNEEKYIVYRRAKSKLIELYPEYAKNEVTWNLYW